MQNTRFCYSVRFVLNCIVRLMVFLIPFLSVVGQQYCSEPEAYKYNCSVVVIAAFVCPHRLTVKHRHTHHQDTHAT